MLHKEIIIIGCGGVGSWIAEFIARASRKDEITKKITLIDHDRVEPKNLERQPFTQGQIGLNKAYATASNILRINREIEPNIIKKKIEDTDDLLQFNRDTLTIISTDNQESKNLIAEYFNNFIITNCDHDFAEIKTKLDETDRKAWTMEEGYTSRQDIQSNIRAAQMALTAIMETKKPAKGKHQTRVQTEEWEEDDIRGDRETENTNEDE